MRRKSREMDTMSQKLGFSTQQERQQELLRLFPNGAAMGQAVVSNFLFILAAMKGLDSTKPFLTNEDIGFIRAYLREQPQEERDIYNVYAELYYMLGDMANAMMTYQQAFAHGVCSAMNVLSTAKLSFEALSLLPEEAISSDRGKNLKAAADASIPIIGNRLNDVWENLVISSLIALNVFDYALEMCEKRTKFDFGAIRTHSPYKTDYDTAWLSSIEAKDELKYHMSLCKEGTLNPKLHVDVTKEALDALTKISKIRFESIKLTTKTKKQIAQVVSSRNVLNRAIIDPLRTIIVEAQRARGLNAR